MFTIPQIKDAHLRVKSGADFPKYFRDLITLGVKSYETFVSEGNTIYYGDGFNASSEISPVTLKIKDVCDAEQFKAHLKAHQGGETDYPTFREDCAKSGVEKWIVKMDTKTCSYYDKAGNEVLVEQIPI